MKHICTFVHILNMLPPNLTRIAIYRELHLKRYFSSDFYNCTHNIPT